MIGKGENSATIPEPEIGSLGGKDRGPLHSSTNSFAAHSQTASFTTSQILLYARKANSKPHFTKPTIPSATSSSCWRPLKMLKYSRLRFQT